MSSAAIGFCISVVTLMALSRLFNYEAARGRRFGERYRARVDFFILKVSYGTRTVFRYLSKDLLRQVIHYTFHTILHVGLAIVRLLERGIKNVMRVNKTIAKKAERESEVRTKLDEIAVHKMATALSEEEKRARKEQMLNGQ